MDGYRDDITDKEIQERVSKVHEYAKNQLNEFCLQMDSRQVIDLGDKFDQLFELERWCKYDDVPRIESIDALIAFLVENNDIRPPLLSVTNRGNLYGMWIYVDFRDPPRVTIEFIDPSRIEFRKMFGKTHTDYSYDMFTCKSSVEYVSQFIKTNNVSDMMKIKESDSNAENN